MPVLPNPRHERFAQELAKGATNDQAYVAAGYAPNRCNASRLKTTETIGKRVAELQGMAAARVVQKAAVIDKSYVLQQAVKLHEMSISAADSLDGFNAAAANAAARALDMVGRHKDIRAFADETDINVRITVDSALSKLAALEEPIEGEYMAVDGPDMHEAHSSE